MLADGTIVQSALSSYEGDMIRMQQEQLFAGLRSDGKQLTPSILEDPFFRSKKSAERYAQRKKRLMIGFPNENKRRFATPNLYINGYFHEGFYIKYTREGVEMRNHHKIIRGKYNRQNLYDKYGMDAFGLTDSNWGAILRVAKDDMRKLIVTLL